MEQVVIIAVIGLISLVNWIVQKSAEAREKRKLEQARERGEDFAPPPIPAAGQPAWDDGRDDAMRRLMEALGLPEEAPPPLAPLRPAPDLPPPLPPVRATAAIPPKAAAAPYKSAPLHDWTKSTEIAVAGSGGKLRQSLGTVHGLREAVILSEILGPPKAFR